MTLHISYFLVIYAFESAINPYDLEICISCNIIVVIGETWNDINARRPCPQPDEKACAVDARIYRCTRVSVHARSRWFVYPIDHILLWLLLLSYCEMSYQGWVYARKNALICGTSLNARAFSDYPRRFLKRVPPRNRAAHGININCCVLVRQIGCSCFAESWNSSRSVISTL